MKLARSSPCKINLLLNILGRRPDGFHELETVMHPVPVCDTLEFATAARGFELTGSDPALPMDASNLVHRAATAFLQAAGIRDGVRIHLEKHIPMAAGLGGGSGNAATTLLGLNDLFGHPLDAAALTALAAQLGSDVPFFLQPGPALATGRGEHVQAFGWFPAFHDAWVLLIHPGFGIATAWAYQSLARFPRALNGVPGRSARLIARLEQPDLAAAGAEFYNSLEAPALEKYPILQLFQEFLRGEGAAATLMSGSGSTTFAVITGEPGAQRLREKFLSRFGMRNWTAVAPLHGGVAAT